MGIESSCDETSCAILKNNKLVANIVSTQIEVHQKYGGVMPEIASRLHLENILVVINEAIEKAHIKLEDVTAFAVTRGPGLIGALHVGLQAIKTLALIYNKPIIPIHHLAGHIYANEFVSPLKFPTLALVVSGGNTELVYMKEHLSFEVIGETLDDAVGESFDKVARVLGLPYPGGVSIDKLSKEGVHEYNLPNMKHEDTLNFSYSGLKTAVINLVHKLEQNNQQVNIANMAKSFQDVAIKELLDKVNLAIKKYDVKQIVLAGGVSANSYLRSEITAMFKDTNIEVIIPPIWCTTDNAAMIAKVASYLYDRKIFASLDLSVNPSWKIQDYLNF